VEDIPGLINEFIKEISLNTNLAPKQFSEGAIEILEKYHWPGNVRELKNLVERLIIMTPHEGIQVSDIPPPFNRESDAPGDWEFNLMAGSYKDAKGFFEKAYIKRKLKEFNGNVSQTAEAIGLERSNLHKKIKAYGLEFFKIQ
jgi:two-component system nitrogen regulation response regulator NtrX